MNRANPWPELPYDAWKDTCATLHLWTQIVGKIRLVQTPWTNHSWHVTLMLTPSGLATPPMAHGTRSFQLAFDFIDHALRIQCSDGTARSLPLRAQTVADFHRELLGTLAQMALPVKIHRMPNEIPDAIPFDEDRTHAAYDADAAHRWWRAMAQTERVMTRFRAGFAGKCSPVQFFWGSFDLAVTRFSGRRAPEHPGGVPHLPDWVTREAYSHEVSSCGFWPGGEACPAPMFYAYAYPEPPGFAAAAVRPDTAAYHPQLHEFVLPYDDVRRASSPDDMLLEFFQSTYDAAAQLGRWDRAELEFTGGREPRQAV